MNILSKLSFLKITVTSVIITTLSTLSFASPPQDYAGRLICIQKIVEMMNLRNNETFVLKGVNSAGACIFSFEYTQFKNEATKKDTHLLSFDITDTPSFDSAHTELFDEDPTWLEQLNKCEITDSTISLNYDMRLKHARDNNKDQYTVTLQKNTRAVTQITIQKVGASGFSNFAKECNFK